MHKIESALTYRSLFSSMFFISRESWAVSLIKNASNTNIVIEGLTDKKWVKIISFKSKGSFNLEKPESSIATANNDEMVPVIDEYNFDSKSALLKFINVIGNEAEIRTWKCSSKIIEEMIANIKLTHNEGNPILFWIEKIIKLLKLDEPEMAVREAYNADSLLLSAAEACDLTELQRAIAQDANVNVRKSRMSVSYGNYTPLMIVTALGNIKAVELLLNNHADFTLTIKPVLSSDYTVLDLAIDQAKKIQRKRLHSSNESFSSEEENRKFSDFKKIIQILDQKRAPLLKFKRDDISDIINSELRQDLITSKDNKRSFPDSENTLTHGPAFFKPDKKEQLLSTLLQAEKTLQRYGEINIIFKNLETAKTFSQQLSSIGLNDLQKPDCSKQVNKNPINPKDVRDYYTIVLSSDEYNVLMQDEKAYLKIAKEYIESQTKNGYSLMPVGKLEEALAYFESILQIDKNNLHGLIGKATVYEKQGNYDQAESYYRQAKASYDANSDKSDLSAIQKKLKELEGALEKSRKHTQLENELCRKGEDEKPPKAQHDQIDSAKFDLTKPESQQVSTNFNNKF